MQNNGNDNMSFEDNLDKLSHAYSTLEQDGPPELLDLAVLNSARRAVSGTRRWFQFGWVHGVATAAVFVLAFSIILNQQEAGMPVEKNELIIDESELRYRENAARQFSVDGAFKVPQKDAEAKKDVRQDRLQAVTDAPATRESGNEVSVPQELAGQRSATAVESSFSDDADTLPDTVLEETVLVTEMDLVGDAPEKELQIGAATAIPAPAPVTKPADGTRKTKAVANPLAEQQLLEIIKLKEAGDDSWKTELQLFIENNPDYPVPEELRD